MPPSQLVDTLEIGVTQEARAAGKGALAGSRRNFLATSPRQNVMVRFSRHTDGHSDSKFQIAISR